MRSLPTSLVGMLVLLASLLVFSLVLAPRADAYIYWTSDGIGRANLDGTGVDRSFIDLPRVERSVAVDAEHIYWASGGDAIGRANLDGTGVDENFISGIAPDHVAVDADYIYWTEGFFDSASGGLPRGSIARANLDGTGVEREFIRFGYTVGGVAVNDNYIYWREGSPVAISFPGGAIGRASLDGSDVDPDFIPTTPLLTEGGGLAVDAEHFYWLNAVGDPNHSRPTIGRANLDGTAIDESFIDDWGYTFDPYPADVAVDDAHVYWPNFDSNTIGRANLDGTGVDQRFIAPGTATSVAVDALTDRRVAGKASAKRTQKQKQKKIRVSVRVKAKERLTARASGKIKVNPAYRLKPKRVKLAVGETKTLRLRPKKAKAKKVARALNRGQKATARLTVKLTDPAANSETEKLRVRLKR
jgi:hypothetical protein